MDKVWIAIDFSGSVSQNSRYWNKVKGIIDDNVKSKPCIFLWNNTIKELSLRDLPKYHMKGTNGTCPHVIIEQIIARSFTGHLILITDGEIEHSYVEKLRDLVNKIHLAKVDAHIITTDADPDFSVVEPLTKFAFEMHMHNSSGEVPTLTVQNLIAYIDTSKTAKDVNQNYNNIIRLICLVIRSQPKIKDKLIELQNRVIESLNVVDSPAIITDLSSVEEAEYEFALDRLKEIIDMFYYGMDCQVYSVSKIQDAYQQYSAQRNISQQVKMECPIMCEDDVPVILIHTNETLGHALGFKAFKKLFESANKKNEAVLNPFNRTEVLDGVILSQRPRVVEHNERLRMNLSRPFLLETLLLKCYLDPPHYMVDVKQQLENYLLNWFIKLKYFPISLTKRICKRYPIVLALRYISENDKDCIGKESMTKLITMLSKKIVEPL